MSKDDYYDDMPELEEGEMESYDDYLRRDDEEDDYEDDEYEPEEASW